MTTPVSVVPLEAPKEEYRTLRLALPRPRFALTWAVVTVTCGLNGFIGLVLVAIYYGGLTIRGGYFLEATGLLPLRFIPIVIACYVVVTLYFWAHFVAIVWVSIRMRRLAFPPRRRYRWTCTRGPLRILSTVWTKLATLFCPSAPSAEAFEVRFLLREMVEIALQTFQAYKCSVLVSQRYINAFYVAVLTTNCWAAPVIYATTRHWPALQRFRYIWSDLVLDFVSAFVVPVWTVYSLILVALLDNLNRASVAENAFDVPYDDVFLMNTIKAAQQIGVTSALDLVSKLMPFVSMASCVHHIERLVVPAYVAVDDTLADRSVSQLIPRPKTTRRPLLSVRTVHLLFGVWGAAVLVLHFHADRVSQREPVEHKRGCKSSSQPWLVNQFSCTVLEINCYRLGISGEADEIDAAIANLSPHGVSSLIIAHCPSLTVPARLQSLSNLIGLEIANSTLVDWGKQAELRGENHGSLQFLTLARVHMAALPLGLQSSQFPSSLTNINLAGTNLSSLPDDLDTKWRRLLNLFIERSLFTEIPPSVARMQPDRFSMMYNQLTEIPDNLLAKNRYFALSLAHNPITKWPSNVGRVDELVTVVMDYTLLNELPPWLLAEGQRRADKNAAAIVVSAGGSSFCEKLAERGTNTTLAGLKVICRIRVDAEIEAYPFTFSLTNRAP